MEGSRSRGGSGRQRITLLDQMSAIENRHSLAGRTLESVLSMEKRPAQVNRTLLDIIRDEEPGGSLFGHRDKKSWKAFRDRLRLKRAGSAWTSSVHIPASDIPIPRVTNPNFTGPSRSLMSRRNSVRFTTLSSVRSPESEESDDNSAINPSSRPQMTRRASTRYGSTPAQSDSTHSLDSDVDIQAVDDSLPARSFRPQISRHNSTRCPAASESTQSEEDGVETHEVAQCLGAALAEERSMSAREAVAAQEAAEAAAQAEAAAEQEEEEEEEGAVTGNGESREPVRMSLMDLLEETDRQMGFEGSRYTMADYDECEDDDEEEEEEEESGGDSNGAAGSVEHTCCVCMVRHKGAAFIPCGHTFCRLCSRELWVQRGNCPLCNGFILEILDIF